MAYQQAIVRRTPSLVPDYEANMRARIPTLADQLALNEQKRQAEANAEYQRGQLALQNRQLNLQEKTANQAQKEGKAGLATQALGLAAQASLPSILSRGSATNAATSASQIGVPSGTYKSMISAPAQTQSGLFSFTNKIGDYGKQFTSGLTGMNTIGAGSLGFGIGTVVPTKNKLLKTAAGAAGGALMDLFTGGGRSAGTSALFGGLGGLLGGLF